MKVILKKDVDGKKAGEVLEVSDGYAKNFLLRNGLAVLADTRSMNDLKGQKESKSFKEAEIRKEAQHVAKLLSGQIVKIQMKAGANGKLFGSVTTKDIAQKIKEQLHVDVDKRKLLLDFDIKSYGNFSVKVKLISDVETNFFVSVTE
jgi:large subunit ribosomal protein L9